MRFFLKSRRFKIICGVTAVLLTVSLVLGIFGGSMTPQAGIVGSVTQPFRSFASYVSDVFSEIVTKYNSGDELLKENEKLQKRVDELTSQVVDYNEIKKDNEYLRDFLKLKEDNDDFLFEKATLISRDNSDSGYSFTVNKGSVNGISQYDPVITSSGLVGYISEVGPGFSKVTTILSEKISIGALDNRTSDVGVVEGSCEISENGKTLMKHLSRSCSVALNDIIVTSGGGIFPKGLAIGTIESLETSDDQTSITATLKTSADILDVKDVMIITYFDGQKSIK